MIRPDLSLPIPENIGAAHFIGIGGSGMSGLARMFLARGIRVSGSDRADSDALRQLALLGARVHVGHDAANLGDADTVIHTGAIWPENPEYVLAKERGMPVIHRSQALHWLIGGRRLVSVAGAHGKTTSTGMIITALHQLGADPSFVNGGVIAQLGASSGTGVDDLFVVEADESDGTFLLYDTSIALITNVDPDHLDHYGTNDAFDDAFVRFADRARESVVISADDPGALRVSARLTHPNVITFGESDGADVRVTDITTDGPVSFALTYRGTTERARLEIPGAHNAINAAGVVSVLLSLGYELEPSLRAVGRASVYYGGGAPNADLPRSTVDVTDPDAPVVLEEYADHTVVLDVYGAREDPIPGVTGALVRDAFADPDHVAYVADWQEAADYTATVARDGDYVITLGCGNVYLIIPQVLEALSHTAPAGVTD